VRLDDDNVGMLERGQSSGRIARGNDSMRDLGLVQCLLEESVKVSGHKYAHDALCSQASKGSVRIGWHLSPCGPIFVARLEVTIEDCLPFSLSPGQLGEEP